MFLFLIITTVFIYKSVLERRNFILTINVDTFIKEIILWMIRYLP